VIGQNWNAGGYTNQKFAWDLDLWILEYRDDYDLKKAAGVDADWLIDPVALVAHEWDRPTCPFFFEDQSAYFKSPEVAQQFLSNDADDRALQAWLEG